MMNDKDLYFRTLIDFIGICERQLDIYDSLITSFDPTEFDSVSTSDEVKYED